MSETPSETHTISKLIPVSNDPSCYEAPNSVLDSLITPNNLFYIRNHFSVPRVNISTWSLTIDGEVKKPINISYDELKALSTKTLVVTLECAGNSRSFMTPPAEGIPFGNGAIGTAEWTGVPLRTLLNKAGIKKAGQEVVLKGSDSGEEEEDGLPLQMGYDRALPLEKALHKDTLVAHTMNGELLSAEHGWPIRAIVPGWYAMASVKWLDRITVVDHHFDGFFQNLRYITTEKGMNVASSAPLTKLKVKSFILKPEPGELINNGEYTVKGIAWSGDGPISKVEVSTDWGKTWSSAELLSSSTSYAWQCWEYIWENQMPGRTILLARATDSKGNSQTLSPVWNYRGYGNNTAYPVPVEVQIA